jgi:hypothetical protein
MKSEPPAVVRCRRDNGSHPAFLVGVSLASLSLARASVRAACAPRAQAPVPHVRNRQGSPPAQATEALAATTCTSRSALARPCRRPVCTQLSRCCCGSSVQTLIRESMPVYTVTAPHNTTHTRGPSCGGTRTSGPKSEQRASALNDGGRRRRRRPWCCCCWCCCC